MIRIILITAGVVAGVVSGYLVKRGISQSSPAAAPNWPGMPRLPIPRLRLKKRERPNPDGGEADNGAIFRPDSV